MKEMGLRATTKNLLSGKYSAYDYCFSGPALLTHETTDEPIMAPEQYERLLNSDFEDLCYKFEDDFDSIQGNDLKLQEIEKVFIGKIKFLYDTIMTDKAFTNYKPPPQKRIVP